MQRIIRWRSGLLHPPQCFDGTKAESGWKLMKLDESGWKLMELDENGWNWMKVDESG